MSAISDRSVDLLLAAGVSAFVALLVELIAKPSLEARKDRILTRVRSRRDAAEILLRAVFICGQLDESGIGGSAPLVGGEARTQRERLPNMGREVAELMPKFVIGLPEVVRSGLAHVCALLVVVPQTSKLNTEVGAELMAVLPPVANYLHATSFFARVAAFMQVRAAMKSVDDGERKPSPSTAEGRPISERE